MQFSEHELTLALTAAAKKVHAGPKRRARKVDPDESWAALGAFERYQVLSTTGDIVLPVLAALPEVEVPSGTVPTFTQAQIMRAAKEVVGDGGGKLRRASLVAARVLMVNDAVAALPPRTDPEEEIHE